MSERKKVVLDARIAVTRDMRQRLKDYAYGLSGEYNQVIGFLLSKVMTDNDDPVQIGQRDRTDFERFRDEHPELFEDQEEKS